MTDREIETRDDVTHPTVEAATPSFESQTVQQPLALGRRSSRRPSTWGWVVRRLLYGLVVLFAVSLLVFIATQALPGDPAEAILGRDEPERIQALREQLELDRPLTTQYVDWLTGVVTGDFGDSLASQTPVSGLIGDPLKNSLFLLLVTGLITIPLSLLLGALAAVRRDRAADRAGLVTAFVLVSIPEFVVGIALVMIFSTSVFQWLPAVTLGDPFAAPLREWKNLVLPVAVLGCAIVPYLYRLVRASTIDVLESEYIYFARLKGLSSRRVLLGHALPNAVVPAIQASAFMMAYMLGGVIVVEFLFSYPGLGTLLLEAIGNRDLPVIQAVTLIFAGGYVVFNLAADVLTMLATPRLRTGMSR